MWSFLLTTHIDADVDHLIKLHVDYPQAALDTDKLWVILRQSVTQHGSFIVSEIQIEWANYKQSTCDLQGDVISTIPSIYSVFKTSLTIFEAIQIVPQISSVLRLY